MTLYHLFLITCVHGIFVIGMSGILYTMLMERVFKDTIPIPCKRKLMHLQNSEAEAIAKHRQEKSISLQKDPDYRAQLNLSRHYKPEMVVAMSWNLHYNASLSMHRREKEGEGMCL